MSSRMQPFIETDRFTGSRPLSKVCPACLFCLLMLLGNGAVSADIAVVVHKDSKLERLSKEDVADLFLGKTRQSHDITLTPLDSLDTALRERFYQTVADMSAIRVKAYWSRIVFSGQGRPPQAIPATNISLHLTGEPDKLTYVPTEQVTPEMKIVLSLP